MFLLGVNISPFAQNDPIAYSINGIQITQSQLQKQYNNYRNSSDSTINIQDFVDAEINKKLIEIEALRLKIDTSFAFKTDISGVKDNLLKKYVSKPTVNTQKEFEIIKSRLRNQIEVNHILIPFDSPSIFPQDTIAYYNKALGKRELAIESGFKQFEKENKSESFGVVFDLEDYNGYMGWISALMYPPAVDDLLFNLQLGEISMPLRTAKGYHIFQVINKRPAVGDPSIEMVIFNFPLIPAPQAMKDSVQAIAQQTYDEILVKNNFHQICEEFLKSLGASDQDCPSVDVTLRSQLPYPIINEAFQLEKIGEVSEPILTDYGYALIRLKSKKNPPTEEELNTLTREFLKDNNFNATRYKKEMKFYTDSIGVKINPLMYDSIMKIGSMYFPTDTAFISHLPMGKEPLITIRDSIDYSVSSFKEYFKFIKDIYTPVDLSSADIFSATVSSIIKYSLSTDILKDAINQFIFVAVQQELLYDAETNNEEYKHLVEYFKNGLLYTNYYKQMIWDVSQKDINGLEEQFTLNRSKYKLEKERWKGCLIFSNDKKALEAIQKKNPKTKEKLNQIIEKENLSDKLSVMWGSWEDGENEYLDYKIFKKGNKPAPRNQYHNYIALGDMIDTPKDFLDVYEQVKKDYEDKIEKELITEAFTNNNVIKYDTIIDKIQ